MNHMLSVGKTGSLAFQNQINVSAQNISNVSTTGYKSGRAVFQDLYYQLDKTPQMNGNLPATSYQTSGVRADTIQADFTQGTLVASADDNHYAIEGSGFFAVMDARTNQLVLTRSGNFAQNAQGQLVDAMGNRVMTEEVDGKEQPLLFRPTQTANLTELGNNTYSVQAEELVSSGETTEGFGTLRSGYLESSNVDLAQEMTSLMIAQRGYSMNLKIIQTADENLQIVNQLR